MSVSAPAGTRAIRFSFVFISFGTPIFIANLELQGQNKRETYLAEDCFSPAPSGFRSAGFLVGPQAHDRLGRRVKELAGELVNGLRLDRIDEGQHLIEGAIRLVVQVDRRRPI